VKQISHRVMFHVLYLQAAILNHYHIGTVYRICEIIGSRAA